MTETVTIEMRRELARELADVLEHEVANATEMHSTEQVMAEAGRTIRRTLNEDAVHNE